MNFLINNLQLLTYSSGSDVGSLVGIFGSLAFLLIVILVWIAIVLALIIVTGYPLFVMAKNAGIDHPWLAFIPYGNIWIETMLARKPLDIFEGKYVCEDRSKAAKYAVLAYVIPLAFGLVSTIIALIPILGTILSFLFTIIIWLYSIALIILHFFIIDDIYATYMEDQSNRMVFAVLSAIIPLFFTVYMWIIRKNQPNYAYTEYQEQVAKRQGTM